MRIIITGASGYIGKEITNHLNINNQTVVAVKRELLYGPISELANIIKNSDTIINLAGASIIQRWTKKNKTIIYDSRVKTTRNLVVAINSLPAVEQPKLFISASAIGIYRSGESHDESSTRYNPEFVGKVVKDWESASEDLSENINRVIFRIGLVLGKESKSIKNMLMPFKLGLGATIGNGRQPFPFIHIEDVANAFVTSIRNKQLSGIYNLVTPQLISNAEFTKAFASILKRSAFLCIPGFVLKIFFGKAAELLIESPEVVSKRFMEEGFNFKYKSIEDVLKSIV